MHKIGLYKSVFLVKYAFGITANSEMEALTIYTNHEVFRYCSKGVCIQSMVLARGLIESYVFQLHAEKNKWPMAGVQFKCSRGCKPKTTVEVMYDAPRHSCTIKRKHKVGYCR